MADVTLNESTGGLADALMATLMLAVGVVLLVACSNVANLALARGSGRRQESAVRLALGASRWRLVRESLTESLILAAAGGLAGLGVAWVLIVLLSGELAISGTPVVLQIDPHMDLKVLLAAMAATGLALVVAGLGPALQSTRADLRSALVADGPQGSSTRWRGRRYLITAQVTVSVVLLAIAALAVTQLRSIQHRDLGFALDELAVAEIDFESQGYDDVRITRIVDAFLRELSVRPDATAATVASGLPFGPTSSRYGRVTIADRTTPMTATIIAGGVELIQTLGITVTHGRAWDARDSGNAQVVVLDEWTARALFGTVDVVGRAIGLQEIDWQKDDQPVQTKTIVGVVANAGGGSPGRGAALYVPFGSDYGKRVVLAARARDNPEALAGTVRETLRRIDPDLALRNVGTGPVVVGSNAQFFEITAAIASLLGAFAWVLALVGLYGVLTHLVLRRTREIGVRVALGASRRDITRMIVGQGLSPVVLGVVAGLGFGALVRSVLQTQFLRLAPSVDVIMLVGVPALFVGAALLACYLPARRAASVDPNTALRQS